MTRKFWEHFNHGSDIGVRGTGPTQEEAFEQAAVALTAVLTDPKGIKEDRSIEITCEAPDAELLLNEWLNAVIYQMAVRKMVFARYEVELRDTQLNSRAWGETVDPVRHQPAVEVKGATLTELKVGKIVTGNWVAQCVVDV